MEILIILTTILMITLILKSIVDYILERTKLNRIFIFWSVGLFILFCLYFVMFNEV